MFNAVYTVTLKRSPIFVLYNNACMRCVKAKFHYAIWFEGKLVRSWSQTCSELKFGLSSSLIAAN